jgi:hypothetical protein
MSFVTDNITDIVMAEEEAEHSITHRRKQKIGKYTYHSFGERFISEEHAEIKKKLITYRGKFTAIIYTIYKNDRYGSYGIYVRRKSQ